MKKLSTAACRDLLADASPHVREQALQLAEKLEWKNEDASSLQKALAKIVNDKDAKVQLQLACTLGELKGGWVAELLADPSPPARAQLLWRVGVPISALILAVMAIPLSFVNTRARRSYGMVIALLLYFVYNNLLSLSQAWVAQDKLNPWIGMASSHLLMLSAVVILFYRRSRQHSPRRRRP